MTGSVLVTGGASGLGRIIARRLVADGRPVLLLDRDERVLADAVRALGLDERRAIVADLGSLDGARAAARAAQAAEGGVSGLVNNAGGWLEGAQYPVADPDRWLSALTLNLLAPMLLAQALWPALAAAGGAVVNVGSSGGMGDAPYGSPEYGAAKAALRRFSASLGDRADVRVTAVVPGWIGLPRAHRERAAMSEAERAASGPLIPPERVADAVVDLLDHGRAGQIVELLT